MRLVVLESPFAGAGRWPMSMFRRWANIRYARRCVRHALSMGDSPVASHLLLTQRGILRDGHPAERKVGIDAGLAWGRVADATVVYTDRGVSKGMDYGIANAKRAGRPVEYRSLFEAARNRDADSASARPAA